MGESKRERSLQTHADAAVPLSAILTSSSANAGSGVRSAGLVAPVPHQVFRYANVVDVEYKKQRTSEKKKLE